MKTTDLKISRELANALEKAGYEFETYFVFWSYKVTLLGVEKSGIQLIAAEYYDYNMIADNTPAFIMCELWEMLPNEIGDGDMSSNTEIERYYSDNISRMHPYIEFKDKNPCNALAKLAIWCIENKHPLNLPKTKTNEQGKTPRLQPEL